MVKATTPFDRKAAWDCRSLYGLADAGAEIRALGEEAHALAASVRGGGAQALFNGASRELAQRIRAGVEAALEQRRAIGVDTLGAEAVKLAAITQDLHGLHEASINREIVALNKESQAKYHRPAEQVQVKGGKLSTVAFDLARRAKRENRIFFARYNDHLLVAYPTDGGSGQKAIDRWRDQRDRFVLPSFGLAGQALSNSAEDLQAEAEVVALAKQRPRKLDAIQTDLTAMVTAKHYQSWVIAGLRELRHPAEISMFAHHLLETTPNHMEALQTIGGFIDAQGGAPGTRGVWQRVIEELVNEFLLKAKGEGHGAERAPARR